MKSLKAKIGDGIIETDKNNDLVFIDFGIVVKVTKGKIWCFWSTIQEEKWFYSDQDSEENRYSESIFTLVKS